MKGKLQKKLFQLHYIKILLNRIRVNPGKYGQRYKYGQRATNAHTKASLGCDSNAFISPIICTFGFFADCILLDSVPLK